MADKSNGELLLTKSMCKSTIIIKIHAGSV